MTVTLVDALAFGLTWGVVSAGIAYAGMCLDDRRAKCRFDGETVD